MLILDIFAQHATSRDGKLQVELAQLRYAIPRLVEKNTMMSRLTAGVGGKAGLGGRGPGETKLEINRRRARERVHLLEKKLEDLADDRRLRRHRRTHRDIPIIAISGYTNAGKSTMLNALTEGDALAADKLFATLDPISRRLRFPQEREVVITDTVGFIRDLPRDLTRAIPIAISRSGLSRASSAISACPRSRASSSGTRPTGSRSPMRSTSRATAVGSSSRRSIARPSAHSCSRSSARSGSRARTPPWPGCWGRSPRLKASPAGRSQRRCRRGRSRPRWRRGSAAARRTGPR